MKTATTIALMCVCMIADCARAEVVGRPLEYQDGNTTLEGYLAYDTSARGKRPGVIVVHEWWGCNDFAKQQAEAVAALGYVALAVDMYGKGKVTTDATQASAWATELRASGRLRERAKAGLDALLEQEQVDAARVAAIGFCFGGSTVQQMAYAGYDLRGVVSFHGSLTTPHPGDVIRAKILILHGADDPLISAEEISTFEDTMRRTSADWQFISYGGAVHSFTNPNADKAGFDGVRYHADAARRSWAHMRLFLEEVFGGE